MRAFISRYCYIHIYFFHKFFKDLLFNDIEAQTGHLYIFRISFIPSKTAKELYVYLKIGSDDGTSTDAEVKSAVYMGKNMELRDGFIKIPRVIKGKRVVCTVELNNVERCPLEVAAYVE